VELPRLEPLWRKYRDRGFTVVAVEARRDRKNALKLIDEKKLTYPILENGEGSDEVVRKLYRVHGFPSTFVLDREGRIRAFHYGFEVGDEKKIEEEVVGLLQG
jgi:peroxiredoxin